MSVKIKFADRKSLKRLACLGAAFSLAAIIGGCAMFSMPGKSYSGPLPELSSAEKELSTELKAHVVQLADTIGPRNFLHPDKLDEAAAFIEDDFRKIGYEPRRQEYRADHSVIASFRGAPKNDKLVYKNIIAELKGTTRPEEIIVVGGHYDSAPVDHCKAANDNASGVAATLALSRLFFAKPQERTIRFVAFTNEEPPYFWTNGMGSVQYASACRKAGEKVVGMLSLETIGYYSDEPGSQDYPFPISYFYPSTGNFIGFVGNLGSRSLVRQCVKSFRENTSFPSEGATLPGYIPGVGWSDHWSFWKAGYRAVMVTDTAPFRYPYYHTDKDDSNKLDYDKMARVVKGMEAVVVDLARVKR